METYMERALELARIPGAAVAPNPRVGAVIVKDGEIIGEGWHQRFGEPHAEVVAIGVAGDCRGATIYVSLEPCSHFGKTPPCTDLLIKKGFARVVCAMEDPNPLVSGRGLERLRQVGIEVVNGVLEKEAQELNQAFIKHVGGGGPFVSLKLALSLDGKVSAADGSSQWITGTEAREYVHVLRHEHQAIMVGIGTALADDPRLDCRMPGWVHQPIKIVLDPQGRLPAKARILETGEVWVVTRESTKLNLPRAKIIRIPNRFELSLVLQTLGKLGINSVLVEGGANVSSSLIKAGLVDKYLLFFAPKLLGGDGLGFTDNVQLANIQHAIDLSPASYTRLGKDLLAVCYPKGD